jgi:LPXTG-motif cell wall-anchored protein
MPETGGAGGDALLIILAVIIASGLLYVGQKKLRKRILTREGSDDSQSG